MPFLGESPNHHTNPMYKQALLVPQGISCFGHPRLNSLTLHYPIAIIIFCYVAQTNIHPIHSSFPAAALGSGS